MSNHRDTELLERAQQGTPRYVYDKNSLEHRARTLLTLSLPYGLTVRYAVKANPYPAIIDLFSSLGLHFDASSSYEATELLRHGIPGTHIRLSSQQPAHNLTELLDAGVYYTATSLHQLDLFAKQAKPGTPVGLRVNPGIGSGHNNRTTTGGAHSGFGIWHEYLSDALATAAKHGISVTTLHVHVGSGADPTQWGIMLDRALEIVTYMPDVTTLDIGGGFKIARVEGEKEADMEQIAVQFSAHLSAFAERTGRQLHLEIEPGTWLVAHAGTLLTEVVDIVDTGKDGFTFLRVNTGMNDFVRPSLYGAQHRIRTLKNTAENANYVVIGHNCETGDILTPAPGLPEEIGPRNMGKAEIGDILAIEDTGAYCASMRLRGYNAFPDAVEELVSFRAVTPRNFQPTRQHEVEELFPS